MATANDDIAPHNMNTKALVKYFVLHIDSLPQRYEGSDANRLTLLYFAVSGLAMLGRDDLIADRRSRICAFVYSLFSIDNEGRGGFRASPSLNPAVCESEMSMLDLHHIAMTYCALCILIIAGDDLTRLDRKAVAKGLVQLKAEDGSYHCVPGDCEHDLRFLYCACCISEMIGCWDGLDCDKAIAYIVSCQTYEGGFGLVPGGESHGMRPRSRAG
uniref:Prenyltransferase alpha-alpha toroid domain-containing protein n=1 Tax=Palpitomonas bilix TaxID=652834 RepID=A0A7S3G451_9EUKA|mmetsp:Transcript_24055/g.60991  ORF Transcript_24055/g.60991 Transcript_24055/m.60991 type:complete len:215 (+) Transcript_24055:68-712(+)